MQQPNCITSVLLIDADPQARATARQAAQRLHWNVLEAADGLTGIELFRRYEREIDLVVLDVGLPDLDGQDMGLRLRALSYHRQQPLPILPVATTAETNSILSALGCAPTLLKPASVDDFEQALGQAITLAAAPTLSNVVLRYAYQKASATEYIARQHRGYQPRAVVYAPSPIIRLGLTEAMRTSGALVIAQISSAQALAAAVREATNRVLVSDAEGSALACTVAQEYNIPLLILAINERQRQALLRDDITQTTAHGVVDASTDDMLRRLPDALAAVQRGKRFVWLNTISLNEAVSLPNIPPHVLSHFVQAQLSRRAVELLWLDYQGCQTSDIARRFCITEATVQSHWKRLQRRMRRPRCEVRAWFRHTLVALQQHG